VTAPNHIGRANEGIDRARPPRQIGEMRLRPNIDRIVLRISERPTFVRDDPHRHARLIEVLLEQCGLLPGIAPPARDLGRLQPGPEHRQVLPRHGSKSVWRTLGIHKPPR
jgi:hypothetical protein